jgi:organic radical activating enzyme
VTLPPRLYNKADSLLTVTGTGAADPALLARIQGLAERLDSVADPHRRAILDRACRAVLGAKAEGEPDFALRPHIVAELARITDAELPRYLFYRYRYDVFPITHELDAYPPCVQIEPTSVCNYRCVFCYQVDKAFSHAREGHMGQMPLETFQRVVDELHGNVEAVTLASRGEPLLCKQIDEMLAYVAGKFLGLKINTNASFLDERKAHAILSAEPNTLVFSADAADADLYAKLRVNGSLERVLENVRRFAEIKAKHYPDSRTIVRVSGVRYSDRQDFTAIESFWRDYVDQVAFVDYNPWESAYDVPPNGVTSPCSDLWRRAFVWWDGRVNPCDVDYRSTLAMGSVGSETVSGLWTGAGYTKLRGDHCGGGRQDVMPCRGCVLV